jgi:hypothetical protein
MSDFLLDDIELENFATKFDRPIPVFAFDLPFCVHTDPRLWELKGSNIIALCRFITKIPDKHPRGEGQVDGMELKEDPYGRYRYSRIGITLRVPAIQQVFKKNPQGDLQELFHILRNIPRTEILKLTTQLRGVLHKNQLVIKEGTTQESLAYDVRRSLAEMPPDKRIHHIIPLLLENIRPESIRAVNRFLEIFRWKSNKWYLPQVTEHDLTNRDECLWFSVSQRLAVFPVVFPYGGLTLAQPPIEVGIEAEIQETLLTDNTAPLELELFWSARRHQRAGLFRSAFLDGWSVVEISVYRWSRNILEKVPVPPSQIEVILKRRFEDALKKEVEDRTGTSFSKEYQDDWNLMLKLKKRRNGLMHRGLSQVSPEDLDALIGLAERMLNINNIQIGSMVSKQQPELRSLSITYGSI